MRKLFLVLVIAPLVVIPAYAEIMFKEMVNIPVGEFLMGTNDVSNEDDENGDTSNERPEHPVYLDACEIDKYEVTVEEYMRCVIAKKCASPHRGDLKYYRPHEPVRMVNWLDASNYCRWIGKRLPTEAEWEKAARGQNDFINPWGNRPVRDEVSNLPMKYEADGAIGGGFGDIGRHKNDMSGYGVYDMAGGVSEWVADWYSFDYSNSASRNPQGPLKSETRGDLAKPMRTVRGGSFLTNIKGAFQKSYFSLTRYGLEPEAATPWIGFRCAKSMAILKNPLNNRGRKQ
jgi:sulfatase modifying factor 1